SHSALVPPKRSLVYPNLTSRVFSSPRTSKIGYERRPPVHPSAITRPPPLRARDNLGPLRALQSPASSTRDHAHSRPAPIRRGIAPQPKSSQNHCLRPARTNPHSRARPRLLHGHHPV